MLPKIRQKHNLPSNLILLKVFLQRSPKLSDTLSQDINHHSSLSFFQKRLKLSQARQVEGEKSWLFLLLNEFTKLNDSADVFKEFFHVDVVLFRDFEGLLGGFGGEGTVLFVVGVLVVEVGVDAVLEVV